MAESKRPIKRYTGFILFVKAQKPLVKHQLTDLTRMDVLKEIARRWRQLDSLEQDKWNILARFEDEDHISSQIQSFVDSNLPPESG